MKHTALIITSIGVTTLEGLQEWDWQ